MIFIDANIYLDLFRVIEGKKLLKPLGEAKGLRGKESGGTSLTRTAPLLWPVLPVGVC
jgi:hypothetical protein